MASLKKHKINNFILDVDGVMTDGTFTYTVDGKVAKVFGPDDADGLGLIKHYLNIHFITGDKRGFAINKKRIDDMGFSIDLVSTFERAEWIDEKFGLDTCIYMGDGIFDAMVMDKVAYGIAPANAFFYAKEYADFVTPSKGGNSAVAEACFHIAEKFFEPLDPLNLAYKSDHGVWKKKKTP